MFGDRIYVTFISSSSSSYKGDMLCTLSQTSGGNTYCGVFTHTLKTGCSFVFVLIRGEELVIPIVVPGIRAFVRLAALDASIPYHMVSLRSGSRFSLEIELLASSQ